MPWWRSTTDPFRSTSGPAWETPMPAGNTVGPSLADRSRLWPFPTGIFSNQVSVWLRTDRESFRAEFTRTERVQRWAQGFHVATDLQLLVPWSAKLACVCLFGFPRRQGQLEGCVALGTERSSRRKSDSQEAINEHCAKSTCDSDFMIFPKAHCSKVRGGRDSLEKQKLFSCLGFNIYSKCWHVKDYYTHAKWS